MTAALALLPQLAHVPDTQTGLLRQQLVIGNQVQQTLRNASAFLQLTFLSTFLPALFPT